MATHLSPGRRGARWVLAASGVIALGFAGAPSAAGGVGLGAPTSVSFAPTTTTQLPAATLPAATLPAAALPAAKRNLEVTLVVSWNEYRKREAVRMRGKVTIDGKRAPKGTKVELWRTKAGSSKSTKIATLTTSAKGKFAYRLRPGKDARYHARVGTTSSRAIALDRTSGDRSLSERLRTVRNQLGKAKGASRLSGSDVSDLKKPSISSVRFASYARGMLVEVTKDGNTRTWLVRGKILKAYKKAGGPEGKYGVPVGDAVCGLMEKGCLQRFTGGALYEKKSLKSAYGQKGRTKATELLAVARSQMSYRSSRLKSKYNKWTKSVGQPWCAAFQSWVASASGNKQAIPKFARLYQLAPYARKNMTTFTNKSKKHKPKLGTLVFYDFRNGGRGPEPSHVGMVIKAKKNTIVALEGNASRSATFNANRGIFIHERPRSRVVFYAYPNW